MTDTTQAYVKTLNIMFQRWNSTPSQYLNFDLHGSASDSTTGKMVVYGVQGYVCKVNLQVYDTPFIVENGAMVMEANLNMGTYQ